MITITVDSKSYGNSGQYVAQILGRDPKFTFRREFTGKKNGSVTNAYIDAPGLYEDCDIDRKGRKQVGYYAIITRPADCPPLSEAGDPALMQFRVSESDAVQIAKRLDTGEAIDDMIAPEKSEDGTKYVYELRTPGAAKRAAAAQTLDTAIEQCWSILSIMGEKEAKAVLAALKGRVSPPKPKPAAADAPAADAPAVPETPGE